MTENDYFATVDERRVAVHADLVAESDVGEYRNEYIFLLRFTEDGREIVKITEMLDPIKAQEFLGRFGQAH